MFRRMLFLCTAAAALLCMPYAGAELVTLDMQDVTMPELMKELQAQTGIRFQIVGRHRHANQEPVIPAVVAEGRPWKEVLREACVATGYSYRRVQREQVWVEQGDLYESPHRTDAEGYAVYVMSVTRRGGTSSLNFERGEGRPTSNRPGISMALVIEAPTDKAAARIHSLDAIRITDDTGATADLPMDRFRHSMENLNFFPSPDRTQVTVTFDDAGVGATRIEALEGILVLYQQVEDFEFVFDDLSAEDVSIRRGGREITLEKCDVQGGRCSIRLKSRMLEAVPEPDEKEWNRASVTVLDEDGARLGGIAQTDMRGGTSMSFGIQEGAVPHSVVIRMSRRRYPDREAPFRIEGIPLPEPVPPAGAAGG